MALIGVGKIQTPTNPADPGTVSYGSGALVNAPVLTAVQGGVIVEQKGAVIASFVKDIDGMQYQVATNNSFTDLLQDYTGTTMLNSADLTNFSGHGMPAHPRGSGR